MEKLKGNFEDHFSKRLDGENRVIYKISDKAIIVIVISFLGHYD